MSVDKKISRGNNCLFERKKWKNCIFKNPSKVCLFPFKQSSFDFFYLYFFPSLFPFIEHLSLSLMVLRSHVFTRNNFTWLYTTGINDVSAHPLRWVPEWPEGVHAYLFAMPPALWCISHVPSYLSISLSRQLFVYLDSLGPSLMQQLEFLWIYFWRSFLLVIFFWINSLQSVN